MNKKHLRGFVWGAGLAAVAAYWGWTNRRLFLVSDITTGENLSFHELRSRVYYADVEQAMTAAEQAMRRLPRWKLVTRDTENEALEADVHTFLSPFTNSVTVYFFPLGHGQTRVTIRSRSRLKIGDLGRNAAHIRQLQAAMDDRLNADAAF